MKPNVMLTIHGEQRYEGQEAEIIELFTEGSMEPMENGWRISYEESSLTGLLGTTTTFEVWPGHVVLARSGSLQSKMVFEEGARHESLYQMDVGTLMVCVCAQRIHASLTERGGQLEVLYSIQIEQALAGTVRYRIQVTPI